MIVYKIIYKSMLIEALEWVLNVIDKYSGVKSDGDI